MHPGDDRAAARLQHAARLAEERVEVPQVLQDEAAHHPVEGAVREGQPLVQVVDEEAHPLRSRLRPGLLHHARREVHRGHRGPGGGEPQRVPPGAAAEVEDGEPRDVAERLAHDRLLEADERVLLVVVDLGPAVVALLDGRLLGLRRLGHGRVPQSRGMVRPPSTSTTDPVE